MYAQKPFIFTGRWGGVTTARAGARAASSGLIPPRECPSGASGDAPRPSLPIVVVCPGGAYFRRP